MSEQEARALAAELAQHRYWRVAEVFRVAAGRWAIRLEHRTYAGRYTIVYEMIGIHYLAAMLDEQGR